VLELENKQDRFQGQEEPVLAQHGNLLITLQQKQTLIAVYQQTGNMTLAMSEAGIRSPRTAYLWWHRFCEAGEAALQPRSHARRTQNRLSESIPLKEPGERDKNTLLWVK
jgi:hypothetical protein